MPQFPQMDEKQRVAVAKMMIEKIQRFIHGDARQPQRKLRKLNRERVDVDTVNTRFNDAPTPVSHLSLLL